MPASDSINTHVPSSDNASSEPMSVTSPQSPRVPRFDPPLSIALVTSKVHPEIDPDDAGLVEALRAHGVHSTACMWNDPAVDWSAFDALLIRSTWDYFQYYTEFLAWYAHIESIGAVVVNPLPLLIWNSDKRYLLELAAQGVDIIPTTLARGSELSTALASMSGEVVVKPSVSGGAWHTVRGQVGSAEFEQALAGLPRELDYLVQPFMPQIVEQGEWSLLFFGGVYSHAVLKKPGAGDYRVQTYHGGSADPTAPTPETLASARQALQAVTQLGYRDQAYVRVDGVVDNGVFRIMELEFIEPFLHFAAHPPSATLFAAQLAQRWQALRTPAQV
ncbi:ATP-grasp domain-containing protein [Pseudomonas sp. CGJS7]|uniref:ATP-grasp domain-containing protein n=1 Tax=Pseudomonas sp. CGJS7 TaxID=3109348 RepID=UPI003009EA32